MPDSPDAPDAPGVNALAVGEQLEVDWSDSDSAIGDDGCVLGDVPAPGGPQLMEIQFLVDDINHLRYLESHV
jgi:hypothetical protein